MANKLPITLPIYVTIYVCVCVWVYQTNFKAIMKLYFYIFLYVVTQFFQNLMLKCSFGYWVLVPTFPDFMSLSRLKYVVEISVMSH